MDGKLLSYLLRNKFGIQKYFTPSSIAV